MDSHDYQPHRLEKNKYIWRTIIGRVIAQNIKQRHKKDCDMDTDLRLITEQQYNEYSEQPSFDLKDLLKSEEKMEIRIS
ncbi:hypothetical protein pb186bvf_007811 [Paramecium bursaria]